MKVMIKWQSALMMMTILLKLFEPAMYLNLLKSEHYEQHAIFGFSQSTVIT